MGPLELFVVGMGVSLFTPIPGMLAGIFPDSRSRLIQVKEEDLDIENLEDIVHSLDVRDFTNLANSIITPYVRDHHDCKHETRGTFDVYQELLRNYHRPDLRRDIRIAAGTGKDRKGNLQGHMWLELFEENVWVPYESTDSTRTLAADCLKDYSISTKDTKSELTVELGSRDITFRGLPGTRLVLPTKEGWLYGSLAYDSFRGAGVKLAKWCSLAVDFYNEVIKH